jgi:hypothetical protein
MSPPMVSEALYVGPVLATGQVADAVIAAITSLNDDVSLLPRGAYVRVRVRVRCVLTEAQVEAELGRPFKIPSDLEAIMPSFVGRLSMKSGCVEWSL